jgi:hypothetical protein
MSSVVCVTDILAKQVRVECQVKMSVTGLFGSVFSLFTGGIFDTGGCAVTKGAERNHSDRNTNDGLAHVSP